MSSKIIKFVEELGKIKSKNDLHNMYYGVQGKPLRDNLVQYLIEMQKIKPNHLFLGEAAGPNGACRTGIPFTDETTIVTSPHRIGNIIIFQENYNLPFANEVAVSEQSSERVWNVFRNTGVLPLMWNAVPFYPHKKDNFYKIRTPRDEDEIRKYSSLIKELLELFPAIKHFGAIGRKAQIGLVEALGFPPYIKHPSRSDIEFNTMARNFLTKND